MEEADSRDSGIPDALLDFLSEHVGEAPLIGTPAAPVSREHHHGGDDEKDASKCFVPMPRFEFSVEEADWALGAATALAHNGFCVLRGSELVSAATCDRCREASTVRLAHLFQLARARGLQPKRDMMRFSEVCSRTPGGLRFDMRFQHDNGRRADGGRKVDGVVQEERLQPKSAAMAECWEEMRSAVERWVRPVLTSARKPLAAEVCVDSVGCVTSLPGAPDQHFHPDGTADGLINVFCPLVPVLMDNGPTELRPGTHEWVESAYGARPQWDERRQCAAAPLLPEAGGALLLFDYRVYHRGLANRSLQPRPVGYVCFSTRDGVTDAHNFPRHESLQHPSIQ
jgi:hypothetical protein